MAERRIHPETGKTLKRDVRPMLVRYGSMFRQMDVPGWYPEADGDAIHTGADLKAADDAFAELRKAYAAHVKKVRLSLNLTQEEAGEIIGGGKRAFQKYESGTMPPSDAGVALIEVLSRHPEEVEKIREMRRNFGAGTVVKTAGHRRREREVA